MAATLPRRWFLVRGSARCRAIALTFDDGPDPEHTPRVLDVLRDCNVKGTFFLVGHKVELYPDIVRRIAAEGHEIGHHSFWHGNPRETSSRQLLAEVRQTLDALERVLGFRPPLFRPPHGKLRATAMLGLIAMAQGIVLWSRDPRDYRAESSRELCDTLLSDPYVDGDIILLHDRIAHTPDALRAAIPAIQQRQPNLKFTTIKSLTNAHANGR